MICPECDLDVAPGDFERSVGYGAGAPGGDHHCLVIGCPYCSATFAAVDINAAIWKRSASEWLLEIVWDI